VGYREASGRSSGDKKREDGARNNQAEDLGVDRVLEG
jgi:hypothetical protein